MSSHTAGVRRLRKTVWALAGTAVAAQVSVAGFVAVDQFTGHEVVAVSGNSMQPEFSLGDAVWIDRDASPKVGDVITYHAPGDGTVITHRVVSEGGGMFRTKGDNNATEDFSSVPAANVIGVVETHTSNLGHLIIFMFSGLGRLLTYGPVLLLIGLGEAQKIRRALRPSGGARRADRATSMPMIVEGDRVAA